MIPTALLAVIGKVVDAVIPDPVKAAETKLRAAELAQNGELANLNADVQLALGQISTNNIEAASDSFFRGGWRPATGWACVSGLVYQLVFRPIFGWIASNMWQWSEPPSLEIETLMTLLFGMLGLGAYRTLEKVRKVS